MNVELVKIFWVGPNGNRNRLEHAVNVAGSGAFFFYAHGRTGVRLGYIGARFGACEVATRLTCDRSHAIWPWPGQKAHEKHWAVNETGYLFLAKVRN